MPVALVTGATGQVGSHVVDRLLESRWEVRALVRSAVNDADVLTNGAQQVVGDVLDDRAFVAAATGCDLIVHSAAAIIARGGWETYRRLNVDGTRNAIAAAQASGARLVQISSVAVYGTAARYQPDGRKTDEDTPLPATGPHGLYARSKRESEELVMKAHAEGRIWATAVRPDVIYGPRDRQFVPRLARLLRWGWMPVIGKGDTTLAIVHAANVADGAVLAATHEGAGGRAFNLANDCDVTVAEFFRFAGEGLGTRMRLIHVPLGLVETVRRIGEAVDATLFRNRLHLGSGGSLDFLTRDNPFTSDRARRELGWVPRVRPEQGVPDAFRWWLAHR